MGKSGDAEIRNLNMPFLGQHDVGRFYIAVNHPMFVGIVEGESYPDYNIQGSISMDLDAYHRKSEQTTNKTKVMKKQKLALPILISLLLLLLIAACIKEEEEINQAPACIITSPADGQEIAKGDTVTVSIEATDIDGSIIEVSF